MNILTALQVKEILTTQGDVKLVMTLGPNAYSKCHIPGSLNVWDIELAKAQFPLQTKIIVYCSDAACLASYHAYRQLEEAGYQNIWRFAGGLVEWDQCGFQLSRPSN